VKDLVGWIAFAIFFSVFVFYAPNVLGHPDNYIPANPMSTPAHIVPEWYFLPVYAILRSIPNKLGGVLAIALVFACLFALPFLNTSYVTKFFLSTYSKQIREFTRSRLFPFRMDRQSTRRTSLRYDRTNRISSILCLLCYYSFSWKI
jgi:quinol-cytochrome oxidoreductase complex cytochrome b subunit